MDAVKRRARLRARCGLDQRFSPFLIWCIFNPIHTLFNAAVPPMPDIPAAPLNRYNTRRPRTREKPQARCQTDGNEMSI
ncbi:uncharacterized protein BO97DRAFT_142862 [Aspergillus homomorphus CBS 101889]|uniref:Uncharacterized protein n=1 Tax=Aspergillus homomorphus (strain CBS 101889) TaxID=1450537 RepID=A0A395HR09_ASPHC|nr:hypothetical protein BO97DRAFT_142862 [Aspergillus homomorphus CBS 101889]RAL10392.1 hypothetical protein BO97DRAFT_142862 [Aspergillus homomorphus CBS 101889]